MVKRIQAKASLQQAGFRVQRAARAKLRALLRSMTRSCLVLGQWGFVLILAGCLCGCPAQVQPVQLDGQSAAPSVEYTQLAGVLSAVVTKDGRIDADALQKAAGQLDEQLKILAVTGPSVTPQLLGGNDDRLAYWYNARAAWGLKLALLCQCPKKTVPPGAMERPFMLDGRQMTLRQIDDILTAEGGWQAVVAAPGVTLDRAALGKEVFHGDQIARQIPERVSEFIAEPDRFVIDVESQQVRVPPVLWPFRTALTDQYNTQYKTQDAGFVIAMLPYLTGRAERRMRDAMGYRVVQAAGPIVLALMPKPKF